MRKALGLLCAVFACAGPQPDPLPAEPLAAEPATVHEAPAIDEAELLVAAAARADTAGRVEYQHRLIDLAPAPIESLARTASDPRATNLERQIAAWALGELGDPEACHVLEVLWLDTLAHGGESAMARAIGLARCGTFGPLRSMLDEGSLVPRLKAVVTLALLNDVESGLAIEVFSMDALTEEYALFFDLAKGLLGDPSAAERTRSLVEDPLFSDYVVLALARSGAEFLAPELANAAQHNPEPVLREMCLEARAAVPDVGLEDLARRLVEDPAPRVRSLAELLLSLPGQLELETSASE